MPLSKTTEITKQADKYAHTHIYTNLSGIGEKTNIFKKYTH